MNTNKQAIFKQMAEIVSQIADNHKYTATTIKPSDSLDEIFDFYAEEDYAILDLEIQKQFGIDIESFLEDIKTMDDLCIVVTSLLNEKNKQPKKNIVNNPRNFGKQQILQEISKMIADADLSKEKNPALITFETPLEQDFQFIDFAVYEAIEKKYNITIENIDHVKTVGDLCDYIMKKRIAKFQQDKKVYNNPVDFKASDKIYLGPFFHNVRKPSLWERIKQKYNQIVK